MLLRQNMDYCDSCWVHCCGSLDDDDDDEHEHDSMLLQVEEDTRYDVPVVDTDGCCCVPDALGDVVAVVLVVEDTHNRMDGTIHIVVAVVTTAEGVDNDVTISVAIQPRCTSCYDDAVR